jgi:hypothetical protein
MRTRSGESASGSCPLCEAPVDSVGTCSDRCGEQLTRVQRESITYVYVHDSVGSRRRSVSGRPIAEA